MAHLLIAQLAGKFNSLPHNSNLRKKPFENIVGKGENAGNQHFLLCPQCFLPSQVEFLFISYIYNVVCKCFEFGPVQKCAW